MKLIVHAGLHKTASTYLQHLLNDNHRELAAHGIYYQPQPGYPAHHFAAWDLLRGDPAPLVAMIGEARAAGCHTVLLSSEDLEGALHDDRPLAAIAEAARQGDVTDVEWHVVLRDPGACFASLFAQLQHHVYADALALLYDVMRRGSISIEEPRPGEGTPYWYYSFDHHRDLTRLAERTGTRPVAHDYRDALPFPGWRMLAPDGVLPPLPRLPGEDARNGRLGESAVAQGYVDRIMEAIPDADDQQAMLDCFTDSLRASLAGVETYAAIVGKRYGKAHRRALAEFARASFSGDCPDRHDYRSTGMVVGGDGLEPPTLSV